MLDILDVDPRDAYVTGALVACLQARLKSAAVEQLFDAMAAWERALPADDRTALSLYRSAELRGEVTPTMARDHLLRCARLSRLPEWQAMLAWRERILKLKPVKTSVRGRKPARRKVT